MIQQHAVAIDTAAAWAAIGASWAPKAGQRVRESDTKLEKTGDGTTVFNSLPYDNMKSLTFFIETTAASGSFDLALWPNNPLTITRVKFCTKSGTCTVQVAKNGTAINGFGTAQNATTTPANVSPSGVSFVENDVITVVIASASSLTGLFVSFEARV